MRDRWSADRVRELAPDAASLRAAHGLVAPARWPESGADEHVVWGLVTGSGQQPYRTAVDLSGPAYSCSCPSRKFPCKHALALLLRWADGRVPQAPPAAFAAEWLAVRASRARAPAAPAAPAAPKDEEAATRRAEQRARRVADGLAELDRWLRDQVRTGLAHAAAGGYGPVERVAARMVDAQAPAVAAAVRRTASVPMSGADWPGRLLDEYARLWLLVRAYEQLPGLAPDLTAVVRSRVGFTVAGDDVLAGPAVRDRWAVLAVRDSTEGKVDTRRIWLRGERTGRWAVVLLFAAGGADLAAHEDAALVPGTALDADLHFHPGRPAQRALIGVRHADLESAPAPAAPDGLARPAADLAAGLADDPWLTSWPAVLTGTPEEDGAGGWRLRDPAGAVAPLRTAGVDVWPLVATSGGAPVVLAGEWSPDGLRPLTCWHGDTAVPL